MTQVFLNGEYLAASEAKISPMDRGFLFGDGIYEVIPTYSGKTVGLKLHLERMNRGLQETGINYQADTTDWKKHIDFLAQQIDSESVGIYMHVSRGADIKRFHAYPKNVTPTVFAYAFEIPPSQILDRQKAKAYQVVTVPDLRWQRCHIKSTSLLGNVMHFQQGQDASKDEVILYNREGYVTEAAACNVFVIKDGVIKTPKLDHQLLPGITRHIILASLEKEGGFTVSEQDIKLEELISADEIWISSSSKEIAAVGKVDEVTIGDGLAGPVWLSAIAAYNKHKFSFDL